MQSERSYTHPTPPPMRTKSGKISTEGETLRAVRYLVDLHARSGQPHPNLYPPITVRTIRMQRESSDGHGYLRGPTVFRHLSMLRRSGYVEMHRHPDGDSTFTITDAGREALEQAKIR